MITIRPTAPGFSDRTRNYPMNIVTINQHTYWLIMFACEEFINGKLYGVYFDKRLRTSQVVADICAYHHQEHPSQHLRVIDKQRYRFNKQLDALTMQVDTAGAQGTKNSVLINSFRFEYASDEYDRYKQCFICGMVPLALITQQSHRTWRYYSGWRGNDDDDDKNTDMPASLDVDIPLFNNAYMQHCQAQRVTPGYDAAVLGYVDRDDYMQMLTDKQHYCYWAAAKHYNALYDTMRLAFVVIYHNLEYGRVKDANRMLLHDEHIVAQLNEIK